MKSPTSNKFNRTALAWTLGIHLLLLLIFVLVKISQPASAAPQQEMGIEVNLGTDAEGSGTDQPMDTEAPAPESSTANNHPQPTEPAETINNTLLTDAREERVINKPIAKTAKPNKSMPTITPPRKKATPNTNHTAASKDKTTPTPKARYTYPGASGKGGNSANANHAGTGEGNGTGAGDKGVPGGTAGAKNYTGVPGNGTMGINHSIANRRIVAFPEKEAEFNSGGRVTLRITINRDGKIVSKAIKSSPSNTLSQIALRKADQIRFDKSENAPLEQFGTITFVFKTRN